MVTYTKRSRVIATRSDTEAPRYGYSVSGYGPKLPTRHWVRYIGNDGRTRWHRVYVAQYGNSGSAYIVVGGAVHYLDGDTEHDFYGK